MMRIFNDYGAGQPTSSNSDLDPNLNYSQAVLLLGRMQTRGLSQKGVLPFAINSLLSFPAKG
ncbi:hypothetical protein SAMN05443529_14512 [Desulfosporosinus hippei DSM 8344]|uniref:Uncharacterized protein n=1 Tax=Desulfosporosinus hippei DSM 8344 TaxID=1121419 RepID=A0A1G8L618_9FIRM|nr:hypothetical protein SAMN05443529_14512 [Desulfosporosinus hippei DSM 8344]